MPPFNLDRAVADWRKQAIAIQAPEAEDLAELESGLLDRYDEYLIKGLSPEEAFQAASGRVGATPAKASGNGLGWSLLGSYLKVAGRNLLARRWYNLTNYFSLSLGIITAALALLYLSYETSYDAYLPGVENKYRVGMNLRSQGYSMIGFADYNSEEAAGQKRQIEGFAATPGVVRAVQFITFPGASRATLNERELPLEDVLQTNTPEDFLTYFDLEVLSGDARQFQNAPKTALLTEREAERYFGTDWRADSPAGKTLRIDTVNYAIAGVVANPPSNAHFTYSVLLHQPKLDYWGGRTYVARLFIWRGRRCKACSRAGLSETPAVGSPPER